MATETEIQLYRLFMKALRALQPATACRVDRVHPRPSGGTFKVTEDVDPTEEDVLSSDEHDVIIDAIWYPGGKPKAGARHGFDGIDGADTRFVKLNPDYFNNGIGVVNCFALRGHHVFGVGGVVTPNSSGFEPHNPMHLERHELPHEDAVIESLRDMLNDAYVAYDLDASTWGDDLGDGPEWDDSRY